MSEISVLTQRTGAGAKLAEDAVIDGVTYHALGQHAWEVTANGRAANIGVPLAEFRAMTGDPTPVRRGQPAGLININISPARPLHDPQTFKIKDIEPHLGLRRSVAADHPETAPQILWLPSPYEGTITCPRSAIEHGGACLLHLNRGSVSYGVEMPASDLPDWRSRVDGFIQMMERAKQG